MPIFAINSKCVLFIHIPKTGGSSIRKWLKAEANCTKFYSNQLSGSMKVTPQHLMKKDVVAYLGDNFDFQFAVVRDPYERMESEFFYRMALEKKRVDEKCLNGFSHWVLQNLDEMRRNACHCDNHFRRQVDFVDREVQIFKYETGLDLIAGTIQDEIGLQSHAKLGRHKTSQRQPVAWSRRALYKFNQFYERDFSEFGYEMKESHHAVTDHFLDSAFQLKFNSLRAVLRGLSQ